MLQVSLSNEDGLWLLNSIDNNNTDISWSILIGGMNRSTGRKPLICCTSLTNLKSHKDGMK
jgi:hypothetical protein